MRRAYDSSGADVTAVLETFLATEAESFAMIDLYLITFPFGAPFFGGFVTWLPLTTAEVPVSWGGFTYSAMGPRIKRGQLTSKVGLEVDILELTINPYEEDGSISRLPGTTLGLLQLAQSGLFDGATLQLTRLFAPNPPEHGVPFNPAGGVKLFVGSISEPEVHRQKILLQVRSILDLLDQKVPRNVYQASCLNGLYDTVCGLSRTGSFGGQNFQGATTVSAVGDTLTIPLAGLGALPTGFFDLGYLQLDSGTFRGIRRGIKRFTSNGSSSTIQLYEPLPFALQVGEAVLVQAGCDKTLATCESKFGNRGRYRGFPFVPTPETAL